MFSLLLIEIPISIIQGYDKAPNIKVRGYIMYLLRQLRLVVYFDTPTMLKHRGFLPSLLSYDNLIRNGLANSPLGSSSQVKFCLPFLNMLYAPFTSALRVMPFLLWYNPLFILLPLNSFV